MKASRLIFVSTLALATLLAWPGHAAKKGGGGNSGPPSKLLIVAEFERNDSLSVGGISTVGEPYADNNLAGGWSNMPGTGNYTLQLDAGNRSREIELDFTDPVEPPADPNDPDFVGFGYHDTIQQIPLFLSMNRICADGYLTPDACNDGGITEGSLKAMEFDSGVNLLVNFRARFADPLVSKASLRIFCGPDNPLHESLLAAYYEGTDPLRATCTRGRLSDKACMEWSLAPATGAIDSLACRVIRQESYKGGSKETDLGVYNLPFTLTLQRDEDGNGIADCSDDLSACTTPAP